MKKAALYLLTSALLLTMCACQSSGGYRELKADEVSSDLLSETWRMDFYIGEDAEGETYFLKYELDVTFSEVTSDMYGMSFSTASAGYADGVTDNMIIHTLPEEYVTSGDEDIPEISGATVGLVSDGTLTFQIPGAEDAMFHMNFIEYEDVIYGSALEDAVDTAYYYSLEMYLP